MDFKLYIYLKYKKNVKSTYSMIKYVNLYKNPIILLNC